MADESLFTVQTPVVTDGNDGGVAGIVTSTGVTFAVAGNVKSVRFYATTTVSPGTTYTVELWQVTGVSTGTRLGFATILGSSVVAGTWNTVAFGAPIAVTPGVAYRTAMHNNNNQGRYVATNAFFGSALTNGNITAWANGDDPVGLGALRNGAFNVDVPANTYPSLPASGGGACYFIDLVFEASGSTVNIDATTTATATIAAAATIEHPIAAAVSSSATIAAAAEIAHPLDATLTATATLAATAGLEAQIAAAVAAHATIDATITVQTPGIDTLFLPAAVNLLNCLCAALNSRPNPPSICCLRPGDSVVQDVGIPGYSQDECCAGQAYVRVVGFYMTGGANSPFPSPSTDAPVSPCGVPAWGLQLEMGVFRCIRTDRQPTCTEYTEAVIRQMNDAKAMREAACCFEDLYDPETVALGQWSPAGPDGGCVGSTWQVSVEILNECEDC